MMQEFERNPDPDFVLHGKKEYLRTRHDDYLTNTQKTISSKNFEHQESGKFSVNGSRHQKTPAPTISDLERSINDLKMDLKELNESLGENYGKSRIFLNEDLIRRDEVDGIRSDAEEEEDPELTYLIQRHDEEAVSHSAPRDPSWFSDPSHKTKPLGNFPTFQDLGVSKRSVSLVNRSVGRFGSEIATKDVTGDLRPVDVASNDKSFPVRLTAPHIVGIRSLLPPKQAVRFQNRQRAKSPRARSRSVEPELLKSTALRQMIREGRSRNRSRGRDRSPSPRPVWMPTSKHANATSQAPPPFNKRRDRGRSTSRKRPGTAPGYRNNRQSLDLSRSLPLNVTSLKRTKYVRPQVQPQPGSLELSFLRSADRIDTRRALVENSPYQQELARLRLERLRVEEEYLLQLKRESELERIRGPKPKWYEMKGPEFHYECNKNTALHKNSDQWGETIEYRDNLLQASREFATNMRSPVPALE